MQTPFDWKDSNEDKNIEPTNRTSHAQAVETKRPTMVEKTAPIEANVAITAIR